MRRGMHRLHKTVSRAINYIKACDRQSLDRGIHGVYPER